MKFAVLSVLLFAISAFAQQPTTIRDNSNGPAAVSPSIGTATVPPTFSTAGSKNSDPALNVTISPNSGIPAIIQNKSAASSGTVASQSTGNLTTNPTPGNSLVVICGVGNNSTISITDTIGNSFTQASVVANSTTFEVGIFYATNIKGNATDAVTCTPGTGATSIAVIAYEVSGIIGVGGGGSATANSTANQQGTTDGIVNNTGSSASPSSGTTWAVDPDEIAFGAIAIGTANSTPSAFNPWNKDADLVPSSASGLFGLHAFSQPLGDATSSISLSATITSDPWASVIVTFKPHHTTIGGMVTISDSKAQPITSNSTATAGKIGLDTNILSILGTAPSTAGKLDVIGTLTDNNAAPTGTNLGVLSGIARSDYRGGTAATAGRLIAPDVGTDGLLHVATLPDMSIKRYRASSKFAASSTTDNWRISGNASNTVLVTFISFSCTETTAGQVNIEVVKRSAAASGGTSSSVTAVPMDSNKAGAQSAVASYTSTGPTTGAAVGDIDNAQIGCMASATASPNDIYIGNWRTAPIVLRGTAEGLAINLGGAISGGNITVTVEWMEITTVTP